MFLIRAAQPDDAEAIYSTHMASIRQLCCWDYSAEEIDSWTSSPNPEGYVKSMADGEKMFVAVEQNVVLGFTGIWGSEICAVYVGPTHAGRGVGRALLAKAEQQVRDNGYEEARLNSTLTAREFYCGQGWKVVKETVHELRSGMKIPCVGMRKVLS